MMDCMSITDRILLIRSNSIYELINPGPDSYFVYTNQIRDNNGSNVYISSDKVFTYNNEIYALAGNCTRKVNYTIRNTGQ